MEWWPLFIVATAALKTKQKLEKASRVLRRLITALLIKESPNIKDQRTCKTELKGRKNDYSNVATCSSILLLGDTQLKTEINGV